MVKFIADLLHHALDGNEVDDVMIRIGLAPNTYRGTIVVPVKRFTLAAIIGDEMAGTEGKVILRNIDLKL